MLPGYPNGLSDYTCHAFPDDDVPTDSVLVGLISVAVAIPVTYFLASAFEIANDSEAPESWLEWSGWRKLVFGAKAHRNWRYCGPSGQPIHYVRWFVRSSDAPVLENLVAAWQRLVAAVTCSELPWVVEAREAAEAVAEESAQDGADDDGISSHRTPKHGGPRISTGSLQAQFHEVHATVRVKRSFAAAGLVGTYAVWAVFVWCVAAARHFRSLRLIAGA